NQYTLLSLVFALLCFFSLRNLNLVLGLIFFSAATLLDFIDGAVARKTKKATKKGAYLDTICDRYVEGIVFFGLLFLPWPKIIFPAHFWIFLAFFGSLMTTYAKAAAKEKEVVQEELKKGFIGRGERMILLFLVFFLGIFNLSLALYFLIALAILTNLTALQRVSLVLKRT
ncbi:CDP-alcohol phosphatidyltransferase family protein, partial [bacterium]|nr:CDP-alcohol phosphatidyltransferase family protein [bacterium]